MCRRGPVVRLRGQDTRIPVAVKNRQERLDTVARSGHVCDGRASHVLQLEVRPRAMEKRDYAAVVGRGCAQSWSPPLLKATRIDSGATRLILNVLHIFNHAASTCIRI